MLQVKSCEQELITKKCIAMLTFYFNTPVPYHIVGNIQTKIFCTSASISILVVFVNFEI